MIIDWIEVAFEKKKSSPQVVLSGFLRLINLPSEENLRYHPNDVSQFLQVQRQRWSSNFRIVVGHLEEVDLVLYHDKLDPLALENHHVCLGPIDRCCLYKVRKEDQIQELL